MSSFLNSPNGDNYDWASFQIANGTTDYDLALNQAALFANVKTAVGIVIIADQAFGVKLNSTSLPMISVTTAQNPWEFLGKKLIRDAFITNNSGTTMNIEVLLL